MSAGRDLAIAYRIYPGVSKVPAVHAGDKERLAAFCLGSFRRALDGVDYRVYAMLDGCPDGYESMFRDLLDDDRLEIVRLDRVGNRGTFLLQLEWLLGQQNSENVYFAEDDYFYLPGALGETIDYLGQDGVDFVTPYDHLDYYGHPLHGYESRIRFHGRRHWRTAATTTLTFMTTRRTLRDTRRLFGTFGRRNLDSSLWLSVTKEVVRNPRAMLRVIRRDRSLGKNLKKAWLDGWGWRQILFGRRRYLWVPMPSLATHIEQEFLAPGIDWTAHFERARRDNAAGGPDTVRA